MNKIITPEQIKAVEEAFFKVNAPVQTYVELQKFFSSLPEAETKEETKKK